MNSERESTCKHGTPHEFKVRITCMPAPDAEERMRRLFTLLVRYAWEHGAFSGGDPLSPANHLTGRNVPSGPRHTTKDVRSPTPTPPPDPLS